MSAWNLSIDVVGRDDPELHDASDDRCVMPIMTRFIYRRAADFVPQRPKAASRNFVPIWKTVDHLKSLRF